MAVRAYSTFEELLEVMKKEAPTLYEYWNGRQDLGVGWRVSILHVDRRTFAKIAREAERIGGTYQRAPWSGFFFRKKERDGRGD